MAGASSAEQQQALLGDAQQGELWSHVLHMPAKQGLSVQELIASSPDAVIATLQREGVQRVADFSLPDKLVLGRLGDDKIATLGADTAELPNYEAAWRQELGPCCPAEQRCGRHSRRGAAAAGEGQAGQEWCSEIPVTAFVVSIRDAAAPGSQGLLRPLIRRWQAGGCNAATFQLPAVQAVVDWKWSFCRRLLVGELALFVVWLLAFLAWVLAQRAEDAQLSLPELLHTWHGRVAVAADLVAVAAMLPFMYVEACTALAYGGAVIDLWKLLDIATYALQVVVVALHLSRLSLGTSILPVAGAAQCVLLLLRLQFYSRVFPATRFAFVDDLQEVLHDMRYYLLFMVLVMGGYAAAFVVLFGPDAARGEGRTEFDGLPRSFVTMVSWVAGDPNLTLLYGPHVAHPVAACLLGCSFIFCFTIVLLTLLVSLMTTTLQKVNQDAEARQLLSKALVIDELESSVPRLLRCLWPRMHSRYIHVLRVDPSKLDAVRLDRLWKSLGDEEAETLRGRTTQVTPAQPVTPGPAAQPAAQSPPAQPEIHRLASLRKSALPAPSVRWRGSLVDAYLGQQEPEASSDPYRRMLLGEESSTTAEEPATPSSGPDVAGELSWLREEVRELRQLLVAALDTGTAGAGGGAASRPAPVATNSSFLT